MRFSETNRENSLFIPIQKFSNGPIFICEAQQLNKITFFEAEISFILSDERIDRTDPAYAFLHFHIILNMFLLIYFIVLDYIECLFSATVERVGTVSIFKTDVQKAE